MPARSDWGSGDNSLIHGYSNNAADQYSTAHKHNGLKAVNGGHVSLKSTSTTRNGINVYHLKGSATSAVDKRQRIVDDGIPAPKHRLCDDIQLHMQWCKRHTAGSGLSNLSNTCFLNSVLQCLVNTAPLHQHLYNEQHKTTCRLSGFCVLCSLTDLIKMMFNPSAQAIKPLCILRNLTSIAKCLTWGHQEDAHEFLRYTVDAMQRACLAGYTGLDEYSKCTTIVHEIFGGYLRSQVKCDRCHHASNTYDPLLDISVDIKNADSLEAALQRFVAPESLDLDNAYKCERCKVKVTAQKRFSIHRASRVLTIHLKRFDMHRLLGAKVSRHIQFPQALNIRPFMSNSNSGSPLNYTLYGVLVHSGFSCNSGHYYSYVKAPDQSWYCMNDSSVTKVSLSTVLSAEAYILFYISSASDGVKKSLNGRTPSHTITKGMLNGGGDHSQAVVRKRIIGPELPTRLSSAANTPLPSAAACSSTCSSEPKALSATTLPLNSIASAASSTVSSKSHTMASRMPNSNGGVRARLSLVPYLNGAEEEEESENERPAPASYTAAESANSQQSVTLSTPIMCSDDVESRNDGKPSTKLTLSQYQARQNVDNSSTKTAAVAGNASLVFRPRSVNSKVMTIVNPIDQQNSLQGLTNGTVEKKAVLKESEVHCQRELDGSRSSPRPQQPQDDDEGVEPPPSQTESNPEVPSTNTKISTPSKALSHDNHSETKIGGARRSKSQSCDFSRSPSLRRPVARKSGQSHQLSRHRPHNSRSSSRSRSPYTRRSSPRYSRHRSRSCDRRRASSRGNDDVRYSRDDRRQWRPSDSTIRKRRSDTTRRYRPSRSRSRSSSVGHGGGRRSRYSRSPSHHGRYYSRSPSPKRSKHSERHHHRGHSSSKRRDSPGNRQRTSSEQYKYKYKYKYGRPQSSSRKTCDDRKPSRDRNSKSPDEPKTTNGHSNLAAQNHVKKACDERKPVLTELTCGSHLERVETGAHSDSSSQPQRVGNSIEKTKSSIDEARKKLSSDPERQNKFAGIQAFFEQLKQASKRSN